MDTTTVTTRRHFYTPREVAEYLAVSTASVYRWAASGEIQSIRVAGTVRIPAAELARLTTSSAAA